MSYNNYMYGIERSEEFLAHYGIKGMKWGVRKAARLMTLDDKRTGGRNRRRGEKMLVRQYRKAQKKLAKLEKRANNGSKYARRAAGLGTAGALVGGLALAGTGTVGRGIEAVGTLARSTRNKHLRNAGQLAAGAGDALNRWGQSSSVAKGLVSSKAGKAVTDAISRSQINALKNSRSVQNAVSHLTEDKARKMIAAGNKAGVAKLRNQTASRLTEDKARQIFSGNRNSANKMASGISNNTIARLGAGAVGAGLIGAAGYNAYRAATTKRAANKAAEFRREMNNAFRGTGVERMAGSSGNRKRRNRKGGRA